MQDLGWANGWYGGSKMIDGVWVRQPDKIPEIVTRCRELKHVTQHRNSPEHRGYDNVTACEICGYVYHTDSSD